MLIVCHGGPIHGPEEAARIITAVPGVQGFLGASSMERLPTEVAMTRAHEELHRDPAARGENGVNVHRLTILYGMPEDPQRFHQ